MSNTTIDNEKIHLAIAFDKNYTTLCYVLLTSIFANNKNQSFAVHAIATGVSDNEKALIKEFVSRYDSEIAFYTIDEKQLKSAAVLKNSHITLAAYYRLFFPSLIPTEIKKLLYLDVDIVVIGSLKDLYLTNISPHPAGAIVDSNTITRPELGITKEYNYFNSGVLLMDVELWRKENITEKAFAYLHQNPDKIRYEDQDALNATLIDNWYKLDKKYNVTKFDIPYNLKQSDYSKFIADKVIIHYTNGRDKPWRILNKNKLRFLYHEYLKKSPRKDEPKYKDFKLKPNIIYHLCKIRLSEFLVSYPAVHKAVSKANYRIRELVGIGNKESSKKRKRVLEHF